MTVNLTYKNLRELEFLNGLSRQDIEENLKDYKDFLNVLYDLKMFIANSKIKFPFWKLAIETFITKTILHCFTLSEIVKGQEIDLKSIKDKHYTIIDIPSANVIFRTQLEAFLMVDFIYFQPKNEDESRFRHACWDYSSLKSISKFKTKKGGILEKEIEESKKEINQLWVEISHSRYFSSLTKPQQRNLKNYGNSRLNNSWDHLMTLSKLQPLLFDNLYSMLSKHAHSESFGISHLKSSQLGYYKYNQETYLLIFLSKSLICLFIDRLINHIKTAEIKFNMMSPKISNDIKICANFINAEKIKTSR